MSDILDQSMNLRPISSNTAIKTEKTKSSIQANTSALNTDTNISKLVIGNSSGRRINSGKNKTGISKNSRRPNVKKPVVEYNSVSAIPINEKTALYSTWTPLSDETANQKLYGERKLLVNKWFESWNDKQRKLVIDDIFSLCKPNQLIHAKSYLNRITPTYHLDFTRILPRVLSLYIFSFLDPKSLSESAKVCWYWKVLSEQDQLWIPKCSKLNWLMDYRPSPFETGIWKRFYIHNVELLRSIPIKRAPSPVMSENSDGSLDEPKKNKFQYSDYFMRSFLRSKMRTINQINSNPIDKRPPWRTNSFAPNQLYRFNYLESEKDALEKRANHLIKTLSLDSPSKRIHNKTINNKKTNLDKSNTSSTRTVSHNEIKPTNGHNNTKRPLSATSVKTVNSQTKSTTHKADTSSNTVLKSYSHISESKKDKKYPWKFVEAISDDDA